MEEAAAGTAERVAERLGGEAWLCDHDAEVIAATLLSHGLREAVEHAIDGHKKSGCVWCQATLTALLGETP